MIVKRVYTFIRGQGKLITSEGTIIVSKGDVIVAPTHDKENREFPLNLTAITPLVYEWRYEFFERESIKSIQEQKKSWIWLK